MLDRTPIGRIVPLLALILIAGQPSPSSGQQKPQAAPAEFPGFSVGVTLSDKAKTLLTDRKETIVVAAYFTGSPKPGTPRRYVSHEGDIGLGEAHVEVAIGVIANFRPAKLDSDALKHIDKRGPLLLINVYSGRKSSPDNLLDCGIYEDALAPIQGKTIPIACKLIGE